MTKIVAVDIQQAHEETTGAQAIAHAAERRDSERCVVLWCAVMEMFVFDILKRHRLSRGPIKYLPKHDRTWLRQVNTYDPDHFMDSQWFEDVCGFVGVSPNRLRAHLRTKLKEAA